MSEKLHTENNAALKQKAILVFDSGVGGLSICKEIMDAEPTLQVYYISDNDAFPYGEKSQEYLIKRVNTVILEALKEIEIDAIIIACNTASTIVLNSLRSNYDIPIIGVVPAIKTAGELSQNRVFGLLATPGTVEREYTQQLISDFANDCTVISVGSSILVETIENHLYGKPLDKNVIKEIIAQFESHSEGKFIDYVVLGCTHFPLIKKTFQEFKPEWHWIDSGPAIAKRLQSVLGKEYRETTSTLDSQQENKQHTAFFTKEERNYNNSSYGINDWLNEKGFCTRLLRVKQSQD